jgi:uncharacterized protein (DUF2062 family)
MTRTNALRTYRWLEPILDLMRQGVSPEKIALTIALGVTLGVTPVLGSTTLLCALAAFAFRINLPAIQLVNGAVYPLQLILLIPFYRMGAWLFGADASSISLRGVATLIREGLWHAIQILWVVTLHALVVWLVLGSVSSAILYVVFLPIVRFSWKKVRLASTIPRDR